MKRHNKISTLSYFVKRLKDNGFVTHVIVSKYTDHDTRKWTVLVDPQYSAVFITCFVNKDGVGDVSFVFDDGDSNFRRSFVLKTESMEVIIAKLIKGKVKQRN